MAARGVIPRVMPAALQEPVGAPAGQVTPGTVHLLMARPLAIEFTVVFEDWGRVQRLFEVPT